MKPIRIIASAFVLVMVILAWDVFVPRDYPGPVQQYRRGTRCWTLSTGSKIAYTLIPAQVAAPDPAQAAALIPAQAAPKPYPIIYLHGGPGGPISDGNIKTLAPLAAEGYDVYLYDQIGCGLSDRLADISEYTPDRQKRDLEEITRLIGAKKVILMGQSWGAILAVLFAADDPGKIDRIIFTGPGPIPHVLQKTKTIVPPDSLHLKVPLFSNRQGNEKTANMRSRMMAFWAITFGKKLASDREADAFATYVNSETNKSVVFDTSRAPKAVGGAGYYVQVMTMYQFNDGADPRPKLRNSPIPVLVMRGQYDNQPWGYASEYLDLFPHHQLVILPNAGHAMAIEQPKLYLETILGFLRATFPATSSSSSP